jgi:hypothetical protein
MDGDTTKATLLRVLQAERERWEELLVEVGTARLTQPGVVDDWSVKDLLGHLAAYLRYWGTQLHGAATGVTPMPRELFGTEEIPGGLGAVTLNEQNAMIRDRYRALPVPVVLAEWREAFDLLVEGVQAVSEGDLTTPGRFAWAGEGTVAEAMAVPTYQHARTHAQDFRDWLDRL